jgi:formylglycine-generating enzyme required for sulfatase activity
VDWIIGRIRPILSKSWGWLVAILIIVVIVVAVISHRSENPTAPNHPSVITPVKKQPSDQTEINNPATINPPVFADWSFDAAEAARRQDEVSKSLKVDKNLSLKLGNGVKMELVLIPAGKFIMGSPDSEGYSDETQHEVTITKPYYIGIYTVTQEQYEALMGVNPSHFKGPQNPVEQVSWDDAVAFCKKASEKAGKRFRLPTEAEWEYACRAGSKTRFSFGDDFNGVGDYAWYTGNSERTTHPVGQKKPNAFGVYDMHGNVFEWCSDWCASIPNGELTDPAGPDSGGSRVHRGGCWGASSPFCRSARRDSDPPGFCIYYLGFRVVVDSK